jgi:hypothetical protein
MRDAGRLTALLEEGKPVRDRATELGRKAAGAVVEGGSSLEDTEEVVCLLNTVVSCTNVHATRLQLATSCNPESNSASFSNFPRPRWTRFRVCFQLQSNRLL